MKRLSVLSLTVITSAASIATIAGCAYEGDLAGDETYTNHDEKGIDTRTAALTTLPEETDDSLPSQAFVDPFDRSVKMTEVATGHGWRQIHISGPMEDIDTGETRMADDDLIIIDNPGAFSDAPLPTKVVESLAADNSLFMSDGLDGDEEVLVVHKQSAEQSADKQSGDPSAALWGAWCDDYDKVITKTANLNKTYSYRKGSEAGALTGTAEFTATAKGFATGKLKVRVKRSYWSGCVPYAVSFKNVQLTGNGDVTANVNVDAKFEKKWSWKKEIAKPTLATFNFWIGPVPVHMGFRAPIEVGIDASAVATLQVKGEARARGTFDITCTSSSCSGSRSGSAGFTPNGTPTVSLSGRVQVNPWAHAAIRAYLYGEWVANGQAGVRADLNSDLWAYYGNTCGDGDYDGINEYVSALTMDAAAKLSVTARAEILTKQVYNNSWPIYETSHKFWDLASSTALQPIFNPADPTTTGPSTVRLQMRPCWPYSDNVAYRLSWGDLTPVQSFSAPAKTLTSKSHTYTTAGIKTLSLTAVSDAKGRQINRSRSASVRVVPGSTQGPLGPFDQFAMN